MGDYDHAEWEFQQQLIARMQQQQMEDDDEAERAWQAALAAQGGGGFGSGLLNPKAKQAPTLNDYAPVDQSGMTPEEIEEEAERAWREALALQGGAEDDQPMDEDAERAWREALEAQQEEIDLRDDEYYAELYRNTRINEGNKVDMENDIQELNEQRWKLRDKKAEYYSGMKDLMESSKALDILRGKNGNNKPLRGILKKRLERVKIEKRLTLRMARSPYKEGLPRKRVGFILPEELNDNSTEELIRRKNEEVERLLSSNKGNNDEEFLEMSLQFIQDFKEEEERLKQESEEIKRMEEQVARLEAELAKEGIALAQKYNGEGSESDPLADAKNANLPARVKRGTKGFGGVFIDEVHKMLGQDELEKIEARIAGIPQEDAEDEANDDSDDEKDVSLEEAADPGLSNRVKRGTKGFGGVFMEQVHKMLEEEKEREAAAAAAGGNTSPKTSPPVAARTTAAPGTPPPNRPKPTPPAKPAPAAAGAKPAPPTGMRLQLDKINKGEEERRAAEAAAKREEEEKKNQDRLKQAAEARKILVSPRPATLPSPRGTVPQPPTKTNTSNNNTPTTATPNSNSNTNNTTNSRPLPTAKPAPTTQPTQPSSPQGQPTKTWTAPSPTPRFVPTRPERSSSDPSAPKPAPTQLQPPQPQQPQQPSSPTLSTAQRLEAAQKGGSSPSGPAGRPAPVHPGPPGATPPVPRATTGPKPGPPTAGGGSAIPSKPAPGAAALGRGSGSFIARPSPSMITVKPLNHPEPVKRGVGRPGAVDPLISAKANFFEQKQQQNAPAGGAADPLISEEVIQRRARLDMFKNKILAKQAPPLGQNA